LREAGFTAEQYPEIRIIGTEYQDENGSYVNAEGKFYGEERVDKSQYFFVDIEGEYDAYTMPYMINGGKYSYFTTLAFVKLADNGERNFAFARKPGADIGLKAEEIRKDIICQSRILHVGSLSLTDELSRNAEFIALKAAKNNGTIISYDPNYRASLWDSQEEACKWMRSILEYADIVKVSEEEIELLTGYTDVRKAAESITEYGAKIVLITLGEKGSFVYLQDQQEAYVSGYSSKVVDTTGAGDSFMGGFLYKICESGKRIEEYSLQEMIECVRFGNAVASLCVEREGAIPAMPVMEEVIKRINS